MIRKILVEEVIACAPQRVWLVLTLPAEVKKWFGVGECSFEPRLGGQVRFRWTSGSSKGEVVAWSPPTIFALQFTPGARVEFWCDPTDEGTRLVITSTANVLEPAALFEIMNTWAGALQRIKERAEPPKE